MSLVELLCLHNSQDKFQISSFIGVFTNGQVCGPGDLIRLLWRMKQ